MGCKIIIRLCMLALLKDITKGPLWLKFNLQHIDIVLGNCIRNESMMLNLMVIKIMNLNIVFNESKPQHLFIFCKPLTLL